MPEAIKTELAAVISEELADNGQSSVAERNRIALDSRISFLRLRRGAPSAILLEPSDQAQLQLCAGNGNGNCPSWLFQQSKGHAALLLEDSGQGITLASTSHNGMRDLVSTGRMGHTPVDLVTVEFHFDGKAYQRAICSESITGGDEDDTEVEVAPHPCNTPGHRRAFH